MRIISYRYLPLNFYIAFSLFILFALFIGPIKYKNMNYGLLLSFVVPLLVLFCLGFAYGARGKLHSETLKLKLHFNPAIKVLIVAGFVVALKMWVDFFLSGKSLSFSLGDSYASLYDGYVRGQARIDFNYILNIFENAIIVISMLMVFTSYSKLKGKFKYISIFIILTYLIINVLGSGKQKYFGDVVIFMMYSYFISMAVNKKTIPVKKIIYYSLFFVLVMGIFSYILSSRYSALGISGENIIDKIHPLMSWDKDSLIIVLFGDTLGFPLGMFLGYFSNGLYGLNVCLQLPFEWTYFVGNSYSLSKILEVTLGEHGSILNASYPFRAESVGWGLSKWHSLFSWLASDFTFPGVVFIGGLFGFFYGRIWLRAIQGINYFAKPLFVYLSLGVIFSFSNNQIMHTLSGVITLVVLLLLYYVANQKNHQSS